MPSDMAIEATAPSPAAEAPRQEPPSQPQPQHMSSTTKTEVTAPRAAAAPAAAPIVTAPTAPSTTEQEIAPPPKKRPIAAAAAAPAPAPAPRPPPEKPSVLAGRAEAAAARPVRGLHFRVITGVRGGSLFVGCGCPAALHADHGPRRIGMPGGAAQSWGVGRRRRMRRWSSCRIRRRHWRRVSQSWKRL